jgi:ATP-binding cassette subfamily B protein
MGVLVNVLLLVGVLTLLFREDYRVGLALTVFALAAVVLLTMLRDVAVPHWTAERQQSGLFYGFLTEHLYGTEDIRANGAVGYVMNRFYIRLREWLPTKMKAYIASTTMWSASIITFTLGNAIAFGFGAYLWRSQAVTIGTVYLIVHYTELLRRPIDHIRTQLQELQRASAGIIRIESLLEKTSRLRDDGGAELPSGPLAVQVNNVSFNYEDDEEKVLENVSFVLQPGKVLGLLGRTGSGKTTLARLVLRLYDPVSGRILLNDVPMVDVPLRRLREKVTLVTQDVQLFHASVRDNLSFFDRAISDERLEDILKDLGLGKWLRSLPEGLNTVLGTNGAGLSAGEAQLLAFARCFLADPAVVVLDEASSKLDPATEQLIERAITKLLHNRTGIIIAHRLDTVERADDILILEKGRIVEHGKRLELKEDPASRFSSLLATGLKELLA